MIRDFVRSAIAVILVLAVVYVALSGSTIPSELYALAGAAIGWYFGVSLNGRNGGAGGGGRP